MASFNNRRSSATKITILATTADGLPYLSNNVAVISCGSKPLVLKHESNLYGTLSDSKKYSTTYIKVHDPRTCRCQYRIPASWEVIIQQPESFPTATEEFEKVGAGMAKRGATIFNSLYFRRRDGVMRNALGGILVSQTQELCPIEDLNDAAYLNKPQTQAKTLRDLISIEWGTLTLPEPFADRKRLVAMLDWTAEMYET